MHELQALNTIRCGYTHEEQDKAFPTRALWSCIDELDVQFDYFCGPVAVIHDSSSVVDVDLWKQYSKSDHCAIVTNTYVESSSRPEALLENEDSKHCGIFNFCRMV